MSDPWWERFYNDLVDHRNEREGDTIRFRCRWNGDN